MSEAVYGVTGLGRRLHLIRETVDGCSRGWCGRIVIVPRHIDGAASICRRCTENQPAARTAPGAREEEDGQ